MLPFYKSNLSGQIFDSLIVVDSFEKALTISSSFKSSIHIIKNSKQRFIFIEDKNIAVVSSYGALTKIGKVESRKGNLIIERTFFENPLHIKTKEILNNILKLSGQSRKIVFVVDSIPSMNSLLSLIAKASKLINKSYFVKPTFLKEVVDILGRKTFVKKLNQFTLRYFELDDIFYAYAKNKSSEDKILSEIVASLFKGKFGDLPSCIMKLNHNQLEFPMNSLPEEIVSSLDLSLVKSELNALANVNISLISEEIVQVSQKPPYTMIELLYDISIRFDIPMKDVYDALMSLYIKGLVNNPLEKLSVNKYKHVAREILKENFLEKKYPKNFFLIPNITYDNKAVLNDVEKLVFNLIKNRFIYSFAKPCSGVVAVFDFSVSTLFSESEISFEKTLLVDVSCNHKELFNVFNIEEGNYKVRIVFKYFRNAVDKQSLFEVLSSELNNDSFSSEIILNSLLRNFEDRGKFMTLSSSFKNLKFNKSFVEFLSYFRKRNIAEEDLYKAIKLILGLVR